MCLKKLIQNNGLIFIRMDDLPVTIRALSFEIVEAPEIAFQQAPEVRPELAPKKAKMSLDQLFALSGQTFNNKAAGQMALADQDMLDLVAKGISKQGATSFVVLRFDDLFETVYREMQQPGGANYFEILSGYVCLSLDMEFDKTKNPGLNVDELDAISLRFVIAQLEKDYGIKASVADFAGSDASDENKASRHHVLDPNVAVWESHVMAVGPFIHHVLDAIKEAADRGDADANKLFVKKEHRKEIVTSTFIDPTIYPKTTISASFTTTNLGRIEFCTLLGNLRMHQKRTKKRASDVQGSVLEMNM